MAGSSSEAEEELVMGGAVLRGEKEGWAMSEPEPMGVRWVVPEELVLFPPPVVPPAGGGGAWVGS